jgi:uncharacterized membrane protein YgcG
MRQLLEGTVLRFMDFSSWHGVLATILGLALVTLIGVGVRLLLMMTIQQRRERMNRQINERLRILIAAYKTLGGSFTGELAVDPTHLRELRRTRSGEVGAAADTEAPVDLSAALGSDRSRRIRDAVEASLSDIILLGTEEQVRLAARAARELADGRPVHTQELVVSLRTFIRDALDLPPVPADVVIPSQGPTRPASGGGRTERGGSDRPGGGRAGGGGAGAAGGGAGMGLGLGMGAGRNVDDAAS